MSKITLLIYLTVIPHSISLPVGSFKYLKRNQVKLHDNVLKIIQQREEEKKERDAQLDMVQEIREDMKLLVLNLIKKKQLWQERKSW